MLFLLCLYESHAACCQGPAIGRYLECDIIACQISRPQLSESVVDGAVQTSHLGCNVALPSF